MGDIIGCNLRSMPVEGQIKGIDYKVVLVAGDIKDYAAYIGVGSNEFVKRHGNKLSLDEANIHFCGALKKEKYRE